MSGTVHHSTLSHVDLRQLCPAVGAGDADGITAQIHRLTGTRPVARRVGSPIRLVGATLLSPLSLSSSLGVPDVESCSDDPGDEQHRADAEHGELCVTGEEDESGGDHDGRDGVEDGCVVHTLT